MQTTITTIKFPDITLKTRDAHKLRGFFGNLFKEKSELLHNHYANGKSKYAYPLVQYKVIDKLPVLVGLGEGAELLVNLFLKIDYLDIDGHNIPVYAKNISQHLFEPEVGEELYQYAFKTLWMALNQENYERYRKMNDKGKKAFLNQQLVNNTLSFYKGIGYRTENRIMAKANVTEKQTKFKERNMLAFKGNFVINAKLPDFVGIGKAVSRGFGCVMQTEE